MWDYLTLKNENLNRNEYFQIQNQEQFLIVDKLLKFDPFYVTGAADFLALFLELGVVDNVFNAILYFCRRLQF